MGCPELDDWKGCLVRAASFIKIAFLTAASHFCLHEVESRRARRLNTLFPWILLSWLIISLCYHIVNQIFTYGLLKETHILNPKKQQWCWSWDRGKLGINIAATAWCGTSSARHTEFPSFTRLPTYTKYPIYICWMSEFKSSLYFWYSNRGCIILGCCKWWSRDFDL